MPLRLFLNLDNLVDLRPGSLFPPALLAPNPEAAAARDARLRADGFDGIQLTNDVSTLAPPDSPERLPHCGLNRISTPADAGPIAAKHAGCGDRCITVHAGWGTEDDDDIDRIVEAILTASERHQLPIYIETHRATLTQDIWRTVQLTKSFPEVRFNLDFSHYYCGQEFVYGDWEQKLAFIQPIFDRTRFIHGRIASPGHMQMPIDADLLGRPAAAVGQVDYLAHFREV